MSPSLDPGAISDVSRDVAGAIPGAISSDVAGAISDQPGAISDQPGAIICQPTEISPVLESRPPVTRGRGEMFQERRKALSQTLARGNRWLELLRGDDCPTMTSIGLKEGLTRARIGQVLKLTQLHAEIQDDIRATDRNSPVPPETALWKIADMPADEQLPAYHELVARARKPDLRRNGALTRKADSSRGLQYQFEQSRKLKRMLDSGEYISIRELADAAGISTAWVTHLLNLTSLAPEIVTRLDVQDGQRPRGISVHDVRVLARIKRHEDQRREFDAMVKQGHPAGKGRRTLR